jgi:uncharacterized protein YkwD
MKKIKLYHIMIGAGALLLAVSLHHYHTEEEKHSANLIPVSFDITAPPISAPTPTKTPAAGDLIVRDTVISIGDSTETIIHKLGHPGRIAAVEYDFDYYIYNNDYHHLVLIAVKDAKVVGFYTDSEDFSFHDISYGDTLKELNTALKEEFTEADIIPYQTSSYTAQFLFDTLESKTVTGVYVLTDEMKETGYTEELMTEIALLAYDLTNSIRVRHGLPALSWSSSAAQAARKHSISMAANNFFGHTDLQRRTTGSRLHAEGIAYIKCGENIIGGYPNAILFCHGQYNSQKQRNNILNPRYRYVGIGFEYNKDSIYKTYLTQCFYR